VGVIFSNDNEKLSSAFMLFIHDPRSVSHQCDDKSKVTTLTHESHPIAKPIKRF